MEYKEQDIYNDVAAVERVIESGLSMYPDTFDKAEAKRRLVEVYRKVYAQIQAAQEQIIAELIAERAMKENAREKRKGIFNKLRRLS
jgi:hypothetical protein